ncbi:MAG: aldehyde dehydrogenase family protein [Archangiaceae bacterium]|nr:aldehyde dehydrogenase family protein [Archangiaceae bacterium]
MLDDAKAKGGKVLLGGTVDDADSYIAPTLIEGMSPDARIMHEEVFGPLLPVITFTDLSEVIQRINADPKPLALYLYSKNERHVQRVLAETSSGGACINHCLIQYMHPNLPFGGVNNSGLGSSHGIFGFKAPATSAPWCAPRSRWRRSCSPRARCPTRCAPP